MISKHIERLPENDNYKDLADYIRDARAGTLAAYIADLEHEGEKVLYRWHDGCLADDYSLAIREVQATQNLNTRSRKEKTYHLLVSFRPEDEDKLTEDVFREIEREFAEKLGFGEHQRHCGVHKNTKNVHLHVAYNMIHPVKLTRHEPYRDYAARDQLCRELERRFGLVLDNGITSPEPQRKNDKARTVEALTGQQSFDGYVRERGEVLVRELGDCITWNDIHVVLAKYGLAIRIRANGCVIADRHGKHRIKASSLDRGVSKPALEARLGPFEPCALTAEQLASLERERYTARPLQRGPERGGLYREYRAGIEERKRRLEAIRREKTAREEQIRKFWREKRRQAVSVSSLLPGDRIALLRTYGTHERTALEKCRSVLEEQRREVRTAVLYTSWVEFLTLKARDGNETALAILRSRGEEIKPESPDIPGEEKRKESRNRWRLERELIKLRNDLTWYDKKELLAVSRMRQIVSEGEPWAEGFSWRVDASGTVLFTLKSGGLVRDGGMELTFSAFDPKAEVVARKLARLKFGRFFYVEKSRITRQWRTLAREQERKQGRTR